MQKQYVTEDARRKKSFLMLLSHPRRRIMHVNARSFFEMRFSSLSSLLVFVSVFALSQRHFVDATHSTNGMSPETATGWTSYATQRPTYSPSRKIATASRQVPTPSCRPYTPSRKATTPSLKTVTPSHKAPSPSRKRVGTPSVKRIPSTSRRPSTPSVARSPSRKTTFRPSQKPSSTQARARTLRATPTWKPTTAMPPVHITRTCSSVTFDLSEVTYPQERVYIQPFNYLNHVFTYSTVQLLVSDNKGWTETIATHFVDYDNWNRLVLARVFQSSAITWKLRACRSLGKRNITSCQNAVNLAAGSFNTSACRGVPVGTRVSVVESFGVLTASLSQYLMDSDIHTVWVESVAGDVLLKRFAGLVGPYTNQFDLNPALFTTGFSNGAQWVLKGTYRSSQSVVELARGRVGAVCDTPTVPIFDYYDLVLSYSACDSLWWRYKCDPIFSNYFVIPLITIRKGDQQVFSTVDLVSGVRLLEAGTYAMYFRCSQQEGEPLLDFETTFTIPAGQA